MTSISPIQTAFAAPLAFGMGSKPSLAHFGGEDSFKRSAWPRLSQVAVTGPLALTQEEQKVYLFAARRAHELACRGNALNKYGQDGDKHFGAYVELENGVSAVATNFTDAETGEKVCDVPSAVTHAISTALEKGNIDGLKVKTVVLVNADMQGIEPIPCADCQTLMAGAFFDSDTRVIGLHGTGEGSKPFEMRARTVADMLPVRSGKPHTSEMDILDLPLSISSTAQRVMGKKKIDDIQLLQMLKQARNAYLSNHASEFSGLRTGAFVLMADEHGHGRAYGTGMRMDFSSKVWHLPAVQGAVANAYDMMGVYGKEAVENAKVQALAVYSDDPQAPSAKDLGRVGRYRGSEDTLVVVIEDGVVSIETLGERLPEMYRPKPERA